MAKFWNDIKQKISGSTKPLKEKTEALSKNVGDKTHEVAESVTKTGKGIASTISEKAPVVKGKTKRIVTSVAEKTGDAVTQGKQRLKLFSVKRDIDKEMSELGGRAFELMKKKQYDVYKDAQVMLLIGNIKNLKAEAAAIENQLKNQGGKDQAIPLPDEAP